MRAPLMTEGRLATYLRERGEARTLPMESFSASEPEGLSMPASRHGAGSAAASVHLHTTLPLAPVKLCTLYASLTWGVCLQSSS